MVTVAALDHPHRIHRVHEGFYHASRVLCASPSVAVSERIPWCPARPPARAVRSERIEAEHG
jgi:hypothetical protein